MKISDEVISKPKSGGRRDFALLDDDGIISPVKIK